MVNKLSEIIWLLFFFFTEVMQIYLPEIFCKFMLILVNGLVEEIF